MGGGLNPPNPPLATPLVDRGCNDAQAYARTNTPWTVNLALTLLFRPHQKSLDNWMTTMKYCAY